LQFESKRNMKQQQRPLILVSNDDGYYYPGVQSLIKVVRRLADVVVVTPAEHQSGKSSAITLMMPVLATCVAQQVGFTAYEVVGTPADCVKLALSQLMADHTPDLVVSGINHGYNTGINTLYSGTMACAFEALQHHVPAVAFSYQDYHRTADTSVCEPIVEQILRKVLDRGLPQGVCLNINMPVTSSGFEGIKVTTGDLGRWTKEFEHRQDPYGRDYYWMVGEYEPANDNDACTDLYWLKRGYVSVTPCHIDQTDYASMSQIADLLS